jgi:hypothetical protein
MSDQPVRSDVAVLARREFLRACALLSAGLAGCRSLAANTRLAPLLLNEPHPDAWRPVLGALTETLLPFEDRRFPVAAPTVQQRLLEYFDIERDPDFGALRRALVLFDEPGLFPERLAPLLDEERRQLEAAGEPAIEAELESRLGAEARSFAGFAGRAGAERFTHMAQARRRAYLSLWAHSALYVRRRFYRSAKVLVMIAAYSLEPTWRAISYEGPLLKSS